MFQKEFPDLTSLQRLFRENGELTNEPIEFNMYLVGDHGSYWFRVILRLGDYDIYLHVFSKNKCTRYSVE